MFGLGTQAQLGLGIAIVLQDQFSGTSQKVVASMQNMKNKSSSIMDGIARDYQTQQTRIAAGAGLASYAMYNAAKDGAALSHKVTQQLVLGGKGLGKSRQDLEGIMKDIVKDFASDPAETFDAMLENIRSGARESLEELTRYQSAAASITGEKLGGEGGVGAGILTTMFTFDLAQTKENIAGVTNAIVSGANESRASILSIAETLKYSGFTLKQFGMNYEQAIAFAAKLAQSGISGSSSGVAINQMMIALSKSTVNPSKKQLAAWNDIGVDPNAVRALLNKNDLFHAVDLLDKGASKMKDATQKNYDLQILLGVRGAKGAEGGFGSINSNSSMQDYFDKEIQAKANDLSMLQGRAVASDSFSDIARMEATWETFKMDFVNSIGPSIHLIAGIMNSMSEGLSAFSKTGIGSILMNFAAIAIPTIGVMAGFRAAMIAATFGLRGMVMNSRMGGFSSIMGGLMGSIGSRGASGSLINSLKKNSLGQWITAVPGLNIGGKTYGLGRRVPNAAVAQFGTPAFGFGTRVGNGISSLLGGGSTATRIGGGVSSIASGMGSLVTRVGGLLPMVGTVALIGSIVSSMWGKAQDDSAKEEQATIRSAEIGYALQLEQALQTERKNSLIRDPSKLTLNKDQKLIINLNVDGQQMDSRNISIDPNAAFQEVDEQFIH